MNSQLLFFSAIYLFGVLISAASQVLLKKSAIKEHGSVLKEYLNLQVLLAYGVFVCATLFTVVSYKVVPLSLGPILEATSYLYVTVFGVLFFREPFSKKKAIALLLIVGGVLIYSLSL